MSLCRFLLGLNDVTKSGNVCVNALTKSGFGKGMSPPGETDPGK